MTKDAAAATASASSGSTSAPTTGWTDSTHKTIVSKIEEYGYHNDHDFRCQGLRDITTICMIIRGIYPLESQKVIAKHLVRSARDNSGDVSLYALSVLQQYLPHLSPEVIIDIIVTDFIPLILDPKLAIPRHDTNTDGSAPAHTHPLLVSTLKATLSHLVQTRQQSNNKNLIDTLYTQLITPFCTILNVEDNPDVIPNKSASIHLKLAVLDILQSLSEHLKQQLSTRITTDESSKLMSGVISSIHHHYPSISKSAADCLGPVISLFPPQDQTKAILSFLSRFSDPTIVPKFLFPLTPIEAQNGYRIDTNNMNQRIKLYTPGSDTLTLTHLYALALSTFPLSLSIGMIQLHFDAICSGLIQSLPTALLTTRPFITSSSTSSTATVFPSVQIDKNAVAEMNLTLGFFAAGEFTYINNLLKSIQNLINLPFKTTSLSSLTPNINTDFNANGTIDNIIEEVYDPMGKSSTAAVSSTKTTQSLTPILQSDLILFLQTALVNCLLLDPFFTYPEIDDIDNNNNNDNEGSSGQGNGSMVDPDFDDDEFGENIQVDEFDEFGEKIEKPGVAKMGGSDPDFDDDEFGDSTTTSTTAPANPGDYGLEYDDYDYYTAPSGSPENGQNGGANLGSGAGGGVVKNKIQHLEQLLDQSTSIRSTALTAMVQFNTSTLMSLRQYVTVNSDKMDNIVTIPDSTPLSTVLISNPMWITALIFATRDHDMSQLSLLLQSIPLFLSTVSYINLILRQNNNNNPLISQISPVFSEISNTMINYIKSGSDITITNNTNVKSITLLLPNHHPTNHLALWGVLGDGQILTPLPSLISSISSDVINNQETSLSLSSNLYTSPIAFNSSANNNQNNNNNDNKVFFPESSITTQISHTTVLIQSLHILSKRITLVLNTVLPSSSSNDYTSSPLSPSYRSITEYPELFSVTLSTILSLCSLFNSNYDQFQPSIIYHGDNRFFATTSNTKHGVISTDRHDDMMHKDSSSSSSQEIIIAALKLKNEFDLFLINIMTSLLPFLIFSDNNNKIKNGSIWILFSFLFKNTTTSTLFNTILPSYLNSILSKFSQQHLPVNIASNANNNSLFLITTLHLLSQWYINPTTNTSIISAISHIFQHVLLIISTTKISSQQIHEENILSRVQFESIFTTISQSIISTYTTPLLQTQQLYNLSIMYQLLSILPSNYFPSTPLLFNKNDNSLDNTSNGLNLGLFTILITYVISHSIYSFAQLAKVLNNTTNQTSPSTPRTPKLSTTGLNNTVSWVGTTQGSTGVSMGLHTTTDLSTGLLTATKTIKPSPYAAINNKIRKRDRSDGDNNKDVLIKFPSWLDGLPGIYSKNWFFHKEILTKKQITEFQRHHPQPNTSGTTKRKGSISKSHSSSTSSTTTTTTDSTTTDATDTANTTTTSTDSKLSRNNTQMTDNEYNYDPLDQITNSIGIDAISEGLEDDPYLTVLGSDYIILPTVNILQYVFDLLKLITISSTTICPHIFKLSLLFTTTSANDYLSSIIASLYLISTQPPNKPAWGRIHTMYLTVLTYLTIPYYVVPNAQQAQSGNDTLYEQTMNIFNVIFNGLPSPLIPLQSISSSLPTPIQTERNTAIAQLINPTQLLHYSSQFVSFLNSDSLLTPTFPSLIKLLTIVLTTAIAPFLSSKTKLSSLSSSLSPPTSPAAAMNYSTLQIELSLAILYNVATYPPSAFSIHSSGVIHDILTLISGLFFFGKKNCDITQTSTFSTLISICLQQYTYLAATQAATNPVTAVTGTISSLSLPSPTEQIKTLFASTTDPTSSNLVANNNDPNTHVLPVSMYQKLALFFLKSNSTQASQTTTTPPQQQQPQYISTQDDIHALLNELLISAETITQAFTNATNINNTIDFHPHLLPQFKQHISSSSPLEMIQQDDDGLNINGIHLLYLTLAAFTTIQSHSYSTLPVTPKIIQKFTTITNNLIKLITEQINPSPTLTTLTTSFIHLGLFLQQPIELSSISDPSYVITVEKNLFEALLPQAGHALSDTSNILSTPKQLTSGIYINAIAMTLSVYAYLNTTLSPTAFNKNILTSTSSSSTSSSSHLPFFQRFVDPLTNINSPLVPSPVHDLFTTLMNRYANRLVHTTETTSRRIDQIGMDLSNYDAYITPFILLIHPDKFGTLVTPYVTVLTTGSAGAPARDVLYESWSLLVSIARGIDHALDVLHGVFSTLLNYDIISLQTHTAKQIMYNNAVTKRLSPFFIHLMKCSTMLNREQDIGIPGILRLTLKNELISITSHSLRLETQSFEAIKNPTHTTNLPNLFSFFNISNTLPTTQTNLFSINLDVLTTPLKPSPIQQQQQQQHQHQHQQAGGNDIIPINPSFLSYFLQITSSLTPSISTTSSTQQRECSLTTTTTKTSPAFSICAGINHTPTIDYRSVQTTTATPNLNLILQSTVTPYDTASYLTPIRVESGSSNDDQYSQIATTFSVQTLNSTSIPTISNVVSFYTSIFSSMSIRTERYILSILLSEMVIRKNYVLQYKQGVTNRYVDDCLPLRKNALYLFNQLLSPSVGRGYNHVLLSPMLTNGKSPVLSAFFMALSDFDIIHSSEIRMMWLSIVEQLATASNIPTITHVPSVLNTWALSDEDVKNIMIIDDSQSKNISMNDDDPAATQQPSSSVQKIDLSSFPSINPLPQSTAPNGTGSGNAADSTSGSSSSSASSSSHSTPLSPLLLPIVNDSSLTQVAIFNAYSQLFATQLKAYIIAVFQSMKKTNTEPGIHQLATLVQLTHYITSVKVTDQTFVNSVWANKTQAEKTADKQTAANINLTRLMDQTLMVTPKTKEIFEKIVLTACSGAGRK